MNSPLPHPLSAEGWLGALASPENRVEIDFHGVPAFYTAHRGWIVQPRPFGQHLLYYVVKGSFRVLRDSREYEVGPGMLLWIPPWTSFRCWLPTEKPVRFHRFRLRLENPRAQTLYRRDAPLIFRGVEPVRRWFEEVARAAGPGGRLHRAWKIRAALIGLFAELQSARPAASLGDRLNSRQRLALEEWVQRSGHRPITPAQMAKQARLSADYFARLFRKTYGVSPRTWLVRQRIQLAAVRLLESRLNVGEVAEEFGYSDIFFFSRQFKEITGQSPRQYRAAKV